MYGQNLASTSQTMSPMASILASETPLPLKNSARAKIRGVCMCVTDVCVYTDTIPVLSLSHKHME